MKVITINLREGYKRGIFLVNIVILLIIISLVCKIGTNAYFSSKSYEASVIKSSEEKTVIIDAGHGGEDCGAIGSNGVYEKDLNMAIATELGKTLSENGFAVIYTRTEDALLYTKEEDIHGIRKISDLKNRCKIGAEYPNSIFISIHMNSYTSPVCSGAQTYYSLENENSYRLAQSVQNNIKARLQEKNNRVIKRGDKMYLMENLDNTAILIECGFLTNPEECEKLSEKEYQKELSFSIFCGIIEYMENAL